MARGYCYGISTDKAEAVCFSDGDIEELDGIEFDYCKPISEEEVNTAVSDLLEMLKKHGAKVEETMDDESGEPVFSFVLTNDVKKFYFKNQFHSFKKAAAEITLDKFATEDPYQLRWLINASYTDAAYSYSEGFNSLDQFMRQALVDTAYYVKNAVYMK